MNIRSTLPQVGRNSDHNVLASVESDSTFKRDREVENCVTTDTIVKSITHVSQSLGDVAKAGSTDKAPTSGAIVRYIADIHQLFENVVRSSKPMQEVFSDVADLAPKIGIQQVVFDNACKQLLGTAAKSRQDVDNMIEDPGHPIWKDTIAHRDLDKVMARFYHLCLEALEHFHESLNELKVGLRALTRQGRLKSTWRHPYWLIRSKSPTLGTTEKFPELVQNLKNYNDIFCTLIWQAVPRGSDYMLGSSFGEGLGCPFFIGDAEASHSHFGCTQRASQDLYDNLTNVWTCRDHEVHSLSISLNFDHAKTGAGVQSKDLYFNVAVTSPCFDGPYRLVVKSADSCTCQKNEEDPSWKTTYLRNKIIEPAVGNNTVRSAAEDKVVEAISENKVFGSGQRDDVTQRDDVIQRGAVTQRDSAIGSIVENKSSDLSELEVYIAASRAGDQGARTFTSPESIQHRVPDLGLEEDLCRYLRESSATIESQQGPGCSCLGFLQARSGAEFIFYYVLRGNYQRRSSHSLDDVLVCASSERRAIPVKERIRTASILAAGVLHLNNSSWLPQIWSSKDIHFFDTDDYERCALGEPFLRTHLDDNKTRGPVCEVRNSAATRSGLLSLGLVLIEIAFSAPWRRLQLREDITQSISGWERDFLNLMRLSDTVSRQLGSRYANVVQTCLFQGLGTQEAQGLGKAELEKIMFEDIVRELDRCLLAVTLP